MPKLTHSKAQFQKLSEGNLPIPVLKGSGVEGRETISPWPPREIPAGDDVVSISGLGIDYRPMTSCRAVKMTQRKVDGSGWQIGTATAEKNRQTARNAMKR